MKYHIVTPLSRPENFPLLRERLSAYPIHWHVLLDDPCPFEIPDGDPWITTYHFPKAAPAWMMWRQCINRFVWTGKLADEDRYFILNDDDFFEPDFFTKLDAHPGEVLICSLQRGHQIPPGTPPERAHGTDTLVAAPENMVPCHVSAEQIILSGNLFRRINLALHPHCDGMMIQAMVNDFGAVYVPEASVWFNYWEPGRWNK